MKLLLTGPTGFIGSAVLKLALARGHEVAALARSSRPASLAAANLCWLRGTLASAPWGEIEQFQPEVCLHTAWITAPAVYLESPENHGYLQWSRHFLTAACERGVRRVAVLGTCIEYQLGQDPLSEDRTPAAPVSTYARCKHELHEYLAEAGARQGFSVCWARVFYPYGPGEPAARLCSHLLRQLARGEKVLLKTPDSIKDYIFITDLAAAILAVLERQISGTINLGTGAGRTVRQVAETAADLLGRPGLIEFAQPPAPDPFPVVVADAAKLRALGWRPAVSLPEGLAEMKRGFIP